MKFSYIIDTDQRVVFQRYEGPCTLAHILECARRVWSDPAYCKTFACLVDLTAAAPQAAFEDLNRLIEFLRSETQTTEGRCAAITDSPMITACGMLYQKAMRQRHAFSIFSSPEAALNFLQVKGPLPAWSEQEAEEIAV